MNTLALLLVMMGALLMWAGITDNSIVGLLGGIFTKKNQKANPSGA